MAICIHLGPVLHEVEMSEACWLRRCAIYGSCRTGARLNNEQIACCAICPDFEDSALGRVARQLVKLRACPEAVAWAGQFKTLGEAWEQCSQPRWMLFLLEQTGNNRPDLARLRELTAGLVGETDARLAQAIRNMVGNPFIDPRTP